jgi:hypothetical protein
LMNSLKIESNGVLLLHQSEWAMMQEWIWYLEIVIIWMHQLGAIVTVIENKWFDELLQKVKVTKCYFSIKISRQWCKNQYDTWKILAYECISWGKFVTFIDNRWFDKPLQKIRVIECHFSIKISRQWCKNITN